MQKYLHRIPVLYAVFFTAFLALCFAIGWGALQGDMKYDESVSTMWQSASTVITDLIAASVASLLVIGLDSFYSVPKRKIPDGAQLTAPIPAARASLPVS